MLIATARDAADLLAPLFADAAGEKLVIVHLDGGRRLLALDEHPVKSKIAAPLPLRTIVSDALRRGSGGLVIAHNHPSGDPLPSAADVDATRRLSAVGAMLGITLHDHLVFAGDRCRSFRDLGLL